MRVAGWTVNGFLDGFVETRTAEGEVLVHLVRQLRQSLLAALRSAATTREAGEVPHCVERQ